MALHLLKCKECATYTEKCTFFILEAKMNEKDDYLCPVCGSDDVVHTEDEEEKDDED